MCVPTASVARKAEARRFLNSCAGDENILVHFGRRRKAEHAASKAVIDALFHIHKALGAIGCVTNGSFRDLDMWAPGFQMVGGRIGPSHAHVHMVTFGQPVNIFGMQVGHDDVIHADYHGAVVVPADAVKKLPAAIDLISRREKVILDFCKSPDFSATKLRDVLKRSSEIH